MRRTVVDRRLLADLALLTALVMGCAEQSSAPQVPEPSDPETASTVVSLTLSRGGGIAGVDDTWSLAPGDANSAAAFELAARRDELEAEAAELDQEPVCCDFFVYSVSVHYADGATLQATLDQDPEATVLWELVSAISGSTEQPDSPAE